MLCADFEAKLTDYLEGVLDAESHRMFAEHAMRCPVCHETLTEVKTTMLACRVAQAPPPRDLEARILLKTMPESAMACAEFEDFLTDYLDGFLPAPLYHRWERHAALCERCTELPGEVVRAIGACYTYISEERPVPFGLNERILQATLGTVKPEDVRAPLTARLASRLRLWLDPLVSPQLATVATMLLVAVFVLTNMVSSDGSISGMYSASLRLAQQSYANRAAADSEGFQELTKGLKEFVGAQEQNSRNNSAGQKDEAGTKKQENGQKGNDSDKR